MALSAATSRPENHPGLWPIAENQPIRRVSCLSRLGQHGQRRSEFQQRPYAPTSMGGSRPARRCGRRGQMKSGLQPWFTRRPNSLVLLQTLARSPDFSNPWMHRDRGIAENGLDSPIAYPIPERPRCKQSVAQHCSFGRLNGTRLWPGSMAESSRHRMPEGAVGARHRGLGLIRRMASCFTDRRDPRIEHTVETLVGQRVFALALGYEDLNDHDELRHDPLFHVLAGKLEAKRSDCAPVAGKSTLNRLEHRPRATGKYHKRLRCAEPGSIVRGHLPRWPQASAKEIG